MMHGILNVYKERGFTSHDVVAKLRGITRQKKIGHTGTLDPDAEGVLPVCLGKATRLCSLLTDTDKTYEAVLLLGKETDTQDISGAVIREGNPAGLDPETVEKTIRSFEGEYAQIPPMYSALKVGGRKLYELAREGKTVERKARNVHIYGIRIEEISLPRVRMRVSCSKGTYIRTLCHDIGAALGCGGCMESLIRTRAGGFDVSESRTLEEIARSMEAGTLAQELVPVDAMFSNCPAVFVPDEWEKTVRNGGAFPGSAACACEAGEACAEKKPAIEAEEETHGEEKPAIEAGETHGEEKPACEAAGEVPAEKPACEQCGDGQRVRVYGRGGRFIALYRWAQEKGEYRIEKMFFPGTED